MKFTDQAFAERLGVGTSMVTRWRLRQALPKADNMRAIAEATGGVVCANDFYALPIDRRALAKQRA